MITFILSFQKWPEYWNPVTRINLIKKMKHDCFIKTITVDLNAT